MRAGSDVPAGRAVIMPPSSVRPGHDPALVPFLEASDPTEADRLLAALFDGRLDRTVRDVVRRSLHGHAADADDVQGEAVARVLRALREQRADAARAPIQNVEAYAARVAEHACHEYFRRRHPERARLRGQIWYVLSRDPSLSVSRGPAGGWLCRAASAPEIRGGGPSGDRAGRSLPTAVRAALSASHAPVDLDELVSRVAGILGLEIARPETPAHPASDPERLADPASTTAEALEQAEHLSQLWEEVLALPLRQRTALLLNLRDAAGDDALDLLPLTGTASIRQIAAALAIDAGELARLWPLLPLDDLQIASRLQVSRQQVINLRKAARARLGRRMNTRARPAGNSRPLPGSSGKRADTRDVE